MSLLTETYQEFSRLVYGSVLTLSESGSRSYGTHRLDSDHDFRGVFMASSQQMLSIQGAPQTIRLDGEVDGIVWELLHFCKLAAAANPTVLEVLWADNYVQTPLGSLLRENRSRFLSKLIAKTYGGYALSQVEKAKRGVGGSRGVEHFKREKFKLHTLRLLRAGTHALREGEVLVRLPQVEIDALREQTKLDWDEFERLVRMNDACLKLAAEESKLPDAPDIEAINHLMARIRGL